jgi:hypothetical protein
VPPILVGVTLGTIPQAMVVGFIYVLFNGWKIVYSESWGENTWYLDTLIGSYQNVKLDPMTIVNTRMGRIGAAFLLYGVFLMYGSALILIPRKLSRRERTLDQKRDRRELARSIWTPTAWKRFHLISKYPSSRATATPAAEPSAAALRAPP